MAVRFSTGCANKMLGTSPLRTLLTNCFIDIYTGTQPASPDTGATGTKLVRLYANGTSTGLNFDAPVANVLTKAAAETTWSGTVLADGTAGYFRICENTDAGTATSTTAVRIDGSIATSGADMNLGNVLLSLGSTFSITTGTITLPLS